jgi:hypothetical protein
MVFYRGHQFVVSNFATSVNGDGLTEIVLNGVTCSMNATPPIMPGFRRVYRIFKRVGKAQQFEITDREIPREP